MEEAHRLLARSRAAEDAQAKEKAAEAFANMERPAQARDIIRRLLSQPGRGIFCLDDRKVVENDEFYVFAIGTREFLIDGDESYKDIGGVSVVYKEDGRVGSLASVVVATDPTVRVAANPAPALII